LYGQDPSLFKSTNGGVDWRSLFPAGSEVANTVEYNFFQELSLDPLDQDHIVTTFHANCKGQYGPQCMAESKDGGNTWRLLKGPMSGWTEGSAPTIIGGANWILGTFQNGMYVTTDSGASWTKVGPGCNHDFFVASDGRYYAGGDYGINRGRSALNWELIPSSPHGNVYGDKVRLFVSNSDNNYYTSPDTDGVNWTKLATPKPMKTAYYGYDPDHHVLYMANMKDGLWRMVTR
jgi:hypothetical protein